MAIDPNDPRATASPSAGVAPSPGAMPPAGPSPAAAARPNRRPQIIGGLVLIAASVIGYRAISSWGTETTDNAQVDGHVVIVPARVGGVIAEVRVKEGSLVHEGDILAVIDPADLKARAEQAEAELAAATAARDAAQAQLTALTGSTAANLQGASAGVRSANSTIQAADDGVAQARGVLAAAQARATQTAADRQRAEQLLAAGSVTRQAYDNALTADISAQAALEQARAAVSAARANVEVSHGRVTQALAAEAQARTGDAQVQAGFAQLKAAEARMAQAGAGRDGAQLQLSYTEIKAPYDGVVARRNVEVGQGVAPGTGLIGLVGTGEVWVMANFKETQLEGMKEGQTAKVTIDALPGETFEGKVEAVTHATGARFALIPPDNASGNFTKVVQRVPVRVSLPPEAAAAARAGENAVVTVSVD